MDGEKQKEEECKEEECKDSEQKELKQKPKTDYTKEQYYPPSPQYTSSFNPGSDSDGFILVLTDTLLQAPEAGDEEELKEKKRRQ